MHLNQIITSKILQVQLVLEILQQQQLIKRIEQTKLPLSSSIETSLLRQRSRKLQQSKQNKKPEGERLNNEQQWKGTTPRRRRKHKCRSTNEPKRQIASGIKSKWRKRRGRSARKPEQPTRSEWQRR